MPASARPKDDCVTMTGTPSATALWLATFDGLGLTGPASTLSLAATVPLQSLLSTMSRLWMESAAESLCVIRWPWAVLNFLNFGHWFVLISHRCQGILVLLCVLDLLPIAVS